ncbi:hypothetical protein [Pedobacter sp. JCM 36344]|uniref:hypothetical protein n=1 Tax=Pedobacter sp. JCM 36344 TaxID=3374280 RepID=UPI00397AA120
MTVEQIGLLYKLRWQIELLFTIIKKGIREKISFSNLVCFAWQHLFSHHKLTELIERSEKEWRRKYQQKLVFQPSIF